MDLEYFPIDNEINPFLMAHIYGEIGEDEKIEIADELPDGRLSHIVIKGTMIPVGYVGDDSLELVYDTEKKYPLREELECRRHLMDIYDRAVLKATIKESSGLN